MLPYGLGWFIQRRRGMKILWHYGWDRANSTLIIKVPEREAAFVLLGNSEALSRKFDLGRDENVTRSLFGAGISDHGRFMKNHYPPCSAVQLLVQ